MWYSKKNGYVLSRSHPIDSRIILKVQYGIFIRARTLWERGLAVGADPSHEMGMNTPTCLLTLQVLTEYLNVKNDYLWRVQEQSALSCSMAEGHLERFRVLNSSVAMVKVMKMDSVV